MYRINALFGRFWRWTWEKKWRVFALMVFVVLLGFWGYRRYFLQTADTTFVSTEYEVTTGEVSQSLNMMGTTQFANAQKLTFVNKGKVLSVNVKVGDAVKKGQILATLSADELEKEIESAKKALKNAQKKLKKELETSDKGLDLLEAQSEYEMLLLEKKNLPLNQQLELQSKTNELSTKALDIQEKERAIKTKEQEVEDAVQEYRLLQEGKAGFQDAELLVSDALKKR